MVLSWGANARAVEVPIYGYAFSCETPDGRELKPGLGDIDGIDFTSLPENREACFEAIDRMIVLCRENTSFIADDDNEAYPECLPIFGEQAGWCVRHFELQRSKCNAGIISMAIPEADAWTVDPLDRTMVLARRSNVRAGPGIDHALIDTLDAGVALQVTGIVLDRTWMRVDLDDHVGDAFIYAPFQEEPTATRFPETPLPEKPEPAVFPETPPAEEPATSATPETRLAVEPTTGEFALTPDLYWSITGNQPCKVWNSGYGSILEPVTWSGACVDGKASGEGQLVIEGVSAVYTGTMEAGKLHGYGVITQSTGDRYDGEFHDGHRQGRGTFVWVNGNRYTGQWREDEQHGEGTFVWVNGDIYTGQWLGGEPHGHGVFIWKNGNSFKGEFRNGMRQGRGIYLWANGDRYDGDFRDGIPHGEGTYSKDGIVYAGEWSNGCFEDEEGNWAWINTSVAACGFE